MPCVHRCVAATHQITGSLLREKGMSRDHFPRLRPDCVKEVVRRRCCAQFLFHELSPDSESRSTHICVFLSVESQPIVVEHFQPMWFTSPVQVQVMDILCVCSTSFLGVPLPHVRSCFSCESKLPEVTPSCSEKILCPCDNPPCASYCGSPSPLGLFSVHQHLFSCFAHLFCPAFSCTLLAQSRIRGFRSVDAPVDSISRLTLCAVFVQCTKGPPCLQRKVHKFNRCFFHGVMTQHSSPLGQIPDRFWMTLSECVTVIVSF